MQEELTMSAKELDRVTVIKSVIMCNLTQIAAAKVLKLSVRQVYRLKKIYEREGPDGLISKKRGQPSNRLYPTELKSKALSLIQEHFYDYGPTLASEQLEEHFDICISKETARQWMIGEKIWQPFTKPEPKLHPSRERRPCFGDLLQVDGSDHAWFEGRGDKCTLLVFIDDATSYITELRFAESETTLDYFSALKNQLERYGAPRSIYSDKHGVFKVNHPEAKSGNGLTQFGRALKELNVEIIYAQSAQAKGRVERANRTLQDRLLKALRFHKISDMDAGNIFLEKFRKAFNKKFAKRANQPINLHRTLSNDEIKQLDKLLTIQTPRVISKDMQVKYNKNIFNIIAPGQVRRLSRTKVTVCEGLSGEITIFHKNQSLQYEVYKQGLHVDQVLNRKEINKYLDKINDLEKYWAPICEVAEL